MDNQPSRATTAFAFLHPVFVLLLAPELVNCVLWTARFVTESLNQGDFGRAMEARVGLGLIYSLVVYGALFVVGVATLGFIVWRLIKGVKLARGLRKLSEKSRRMAIATSIVYAVFLVVALFVCNYCDLPSRAGAATPCTESPGRRAVQVLDVLVLFYFAASAVYFTRPKVAGRFVEP
jgi:hypothetical protein